MSDLPVIPPVYKRLCQPKQEINQQQPGGIIPKINFEDCHIFSLPSQGNIYTVTNKCFT